MLPSNPTPLAAALCALLLSAPSFGDHPSSTTRYADEIRMELQAIEEIGAELRDPYARRRLEAHVDLAEAALERMERSAARGDGRDAGRDGWRGNGRGYGTAPATLTFDEALSVVQRESFDSGRLQAIERLARTNRFSSEQAAELARLCAFESTRRDALVALYPAVTDPYRFELALDALDWQSSRRTVRTSLGL